MTATVDFLTDAATDPELVTVFDRALHDLAPTMSVARQIDLYRQHARILARLERRANPTDAGTYKRMRLAASRAHRAAQRSTPITVIGPTPAATST